MEPLCELVIEDYKVHRPIDPHVVVVPIVSSIFVFPILVLILICWLRKMAAKRRQRARQNQTEDPWNERSCASIVNRSPPLSLSIGNGNGCAARIGSVDIGLAPTTIEVTSPEGNNCNGDCIYEHSTL